MKAKTIRMKGIPKREIEKRRETLKKIILEVRRDPELKRDIKKFIEICQ